MLTTLMPYACLFFCLICVQGEGKVWVLPPLALLQESKPQVLAGLYEIPHLGPTVNTITIQTSFPCLLSPAIADLLERPVLLSPQTSVI